MEINPTNPFRELAELGLKVVSPRGLKPPHSLSESLGGAGVCPVPFAHDRLREAHHWWHEMADFYHEPEPFRYRLGAFINAARSVTFMLQSEKSVFESFDWYEAWREKAKEDPVLTWLSDARTDVVHRRALEPKSWMEMRCIDNPRLLDLDEEEIEHPFRFKVSPFACTHYYIRSDGGPWGGDHPHEYERHWEMEGLEGRELLEACAHAYDRLEEIVAEAHKQAGAEIASYRQPGSQRALPCMENLSKYRIVRTSMKEGREVWEDEPPRLHEHPESQK